MQSTILSAEDFRKYIINPVHIQESFYDEGLSSFNNIEVNERILFNDHYQHELRFSNSNFKRIEIKDGIFDQNLLFKDCVFNEAFVIENGTFNGQLFFLNCEFKKGLTILDITSQSLLLENTSSVNPIKIRGANIKRLVYSSVNEKTIFKLEGRFTLIKSLKLISVTGMTFFSKQCNINELVIDGYLNSSSRIDLMDIKIYNIEMVNVNNDGKIYFSNFNHCMVLRIIKLSVVDIKKLLLADNRYHQEIKRFIENKQDKIDNVISLYSAFAFPEVLREPLYKLVAAESFKFDLLPSVKPIFKLHYCSLGILELKDIGLETLDIKVLSSDMSSIKLINSIFPLKIESYNKLNAYCVYNDLYSSANRQNNYKDKVEYYKTSQEALLDHLLTENSHIKNLSSIISIKFSNFYSNHGSNWIKALLITVVIIGLPTFSLFVYSLKTIQADFSIKGFEYFISNFFSYFPQFLNPLHKIDFLDNQRYPVGFWTGWVDLISRILIGIGLFETVRSFRKYVRS